MALRFVLVGLVASLSFELPSGRDIASWAQAGRDWVDARAADVSGLRAEFGLCFAESPVDEPAPPTPEAPPTRDDLAFGVVVDGMARDFVADLASIEPARPADSALAVVEAPREMPPAVPSEVAPAEPVASDPIVAEAAPAPAAESGSRVAKISSALKLTRQALGAWAALIQPSPDSAEGDADEAP